MSISDDPATVIPITKARRWGGSPDDDTIQVIRRAYGEIGRAGTETDVLSHPGLRHVARHALNAAFQHGERAFARPCAVWPAEGQALDSRDYHGDNRCWDVDDLADWCRSYASTVRPKASTEWFGPGHTRTGRHRDEDCVEMGWLVLEVDGMGYWDQLLLTLEALDAAYVAYQSPSHMPAVPKWRIAFPLRTVWSPDPNDVLLSRRHWKDERYPAARLVLGAVAELRGAGFDPSTDALLNRFYPPAPRDPVQGVLAVRVQNGVCFDVNAMFGALVTMSCDPPNKTTTFTGIPWDPADGEHPFLAALQTAGLLGRRCGETTDPQTGSGVAKYVALCPWRGEHSHDSDGTDSTVAWSNGAWKCAHAHCGGRGRKDVVATLSDEIQKAYRDAMKARRAGTARERVPGEDDDAPMPWHVDPPSPPTIGGGGGDGGDGSGSDGNTPPVPPPPPPPPAPPWDAGLSRDNAGNLRNTFRNICAILRGAPGYAGTFMYNEMLLRPVRNGAKMTDGDVGSIRENIEATYGFSPPDYEIKHALLTVGEECRVHPVRKYLTEIPGWDDEQRISRVAAEILGIHQPDELTQTILRKWFISAVARPMDPGCQVDTALVLTGDQGCFKSSFFRCLANGYFGDSHMDIENRDSKLQLHAVWIYEWSEIENITLRKSPEAVKNFISIREDLLRTPYASGVDFYKRSGVIVGSTNKKEFLNDPTGSRRFWVVETGESINLPLLSAWRDQLWAEALHAFRSKEPHHLSPEEEKVREAKAAKHQESDAWEELIAAWIDGGCLPCPGTGLPLDQHLFLTTSNLMTHALKLHPSFQNQAAMNRVGKIMHTLHYSGGTRKRYQGELLRVWTLDSSRKPPS